MMTNKPRAIVVTGCTSCIYMKDWSSAGLECRKETEPKEIHRGLGGMAKFKDKTPNWCPLPKIIQLEY